MDEQGTGPISIEAGGGVRLSVESELPSLFDAYLLRAALVDDADLQAGSGQGRPEGVLFVAAQRGVGWPELVVALRYSPAGYGFHPGVLLVPETMTLFVGAGESLRCYRLDDPPRRLWTDGADTGFWAWRRHGDRVLMSAELELAAWDLDGTKRWTTFVEPPWSYTVEGDTVRLDVMGSISRFAIDRGPA